MDIRAPLHVGPDSISDHDLVLNFESIGDNCELGLVQRLVRAEPLGLLRFSSAPISTLIRALRDRFDGLADPANVHLSAPKGEYMISLSKYSFDYHAHVNVGAVDPEALLRQQTRILPFLVEKLIADLAKAEKILVFRQNEPLAAGDLIDLRAALTRYGPTTLLWVQAERPGHPAGTVDEIDETLMAGYVRRLATRENVPDLDLASWLVTLRRAHALWSARPLRSGKPTPAPDHSRPATIRLVFGADGNARGSTEYGWSPPEDEHTWAIDDRSLLVLAPPADARTYSLKMDVRPFISLPVVDSQRLEVTINGELVHAFDPLEPGLAVCAVPGRLIRGHDRVEILLTHPRATRPSDLDGDRDTRRLAVMFRRLTLAGSSEPMEPARPPMVEIVFGTDGVPRDAAEYGWSPPEHFHSWAIDDRSLLFVEPPADAPNYRLEMDIVPFIHPPALPAQTLEVMVNGELVHASEAVPFGLTRCVVPGRLINGSDRVQIELLHPGAVSPKVLGAGQDTRRLSVAFRRLTLTGLHD